MLWIATVILLLALWGFVQSLFGPRLEVHVHLAEPAQPGSSRRLLRYGMVNRGYRPVTIMNVGGRFRRDPTNVPVFVIPPQVKWSVALPRTLRFGETAAVVTTDLSVLNDNLETLWATDSTGRHWPASRRSLEALRGSPEWRREGHEPSVWTYREAGDSN